MSGKRKKKESITEDDAKEKVAKGIAGFLLRVQAWVAFFMNRKTAALSLAGQKILLALICLLFGGLSMLSVLNAISDKPGKRIMQKPTTIRTPYYHDIQAMPGTGEGTISSEAEFKKILLFQLYMDSLQKSRQGKRIYDSLVLERPGLMDSVKLIISIYQKQKNNAYEKGE